MYKLDDFQPIRIKPKKNWNTWSSKRMRNFCVIFFLLTMCLMCYAFTQLKSGPGIATSTPAITRTLVPTRTLVLSSSTPTMELLVVPTETSTLIPTILPSPTEEKQAINFDVNGDGKVTCADFKNNSGLAQEALKAGYKSLDRDGDGQACDTK